MNNHNGLFVPFLQPPEGLIATPLSDPLPERPKTSNSPKLAAVVEGDNTVRFHTNSRQMCLCFAVILLDNTSMVKYYCVLYSTVKIKYLINNPTMHFDKILTNKDPLWIGSLAKLLNNKSLTAETVQNRIQRWT